MSQDPSGSTTAADTDESTVIDGQGLIDRLIQADILREDEAADDLKLTEAFQNAWWERIDTLQSDDQALSELAEHLGVDETDLRTEDETEYLLYYQDSAVGDWPSRAAFLGDMALQPTIDERFPLWKQIDPMSQGTLLSRLRGFLERCPSCEGKIEVDEEPTSDLNGREVTFACVDCGEITTTGEFR